MQMDNMQLEQISGMFQQAPERISEFKKESYAMSFERHLEEYTAVWSALTAAWSEDTADREQQRIQAAECPAAEAQSMLESARGRTKRQQLQHNLNLYMVSYFLPALIAYQRRRGIPEGETREMTGAICDSWNTQFGQHIQAADYESIQAGFKQKLCFVTTAVCCGLHKPQDCREITLMKRYRDEYLFRQDDGQDLIREYYNIAPTIVKRIARESAPEEKYLYLWNHYISKCVAYVEQQENERCRQLYEMMMSELKEEYMVTDRHKQEGVLHRHE